MYDQISSLALIALMALLSLGYSLRVVLKGSARYDRVDRQGPGVLLGTSLMQMGYWGMQPLGRFFAYCRISANQLSWMSLLLGCVAAVCFALGRFGLASVFSALAALLDGLDGMVARMTQTVSSSGGLLDSVLDRYVEFLMFGGLFLYYRERPVLQALCFLALLGSFMVSYSTAKAEIQKISLPPGGMRRPERMVYLLLGSVFASLSLPFESGAFESMDPHARPIAYPMVIALALIALFSNVSAIHRFHTTARLMKERTRTE